MTKHNIKLNISVRRIFLPLFREDCPRFVVIVAHRRAGKTVGSIQRLIAAAMSDNAPKNARYAYVAPQRNQAKSIAWDYLKRMGHSIPGTTINESELRIGYPNASRIQLYGSDNPDALRGGYLDGVVMDEVAQMPRQTWTHVVRPMLADRHGWSIFIGTPQGKGAFFDLWEQAGKLTDWGRFMFRASETNIINAEELDATRREMPPEAYAQEMDCSFTAAIRGAYYGALLEQAERDGRMIPIDIDPTKRLSTGWDIGTSDATAIFVLMPYRSNAWAVIDYYESSGAGIDHYAAWLDDHGYRANAVHCAPHDVANTDWSAAGGKNRMRVAEELGVRFERATRPQNSHGIMDGIQAVRALIPRLYFHTDDSPRGERVARAVLYLSLYRADYNERLGALKASPLHDHTSHCADALRTFVSIPEHIRRGHEHERIDINAPRQQPRGISRANFR